MARAPSDLRALAESVGASERTLRRGVECGLIRARRLGSRKLRIPFSERQYVRQRWPLLSALRRALRTERGVRLAVLFGSTARGDERPDSDVDVLVLPDDRDPLGPAGLAVRLERALGYEREVQVMRLSDAERKPYMLADILREGRVLVDRDGEWAKLKAREPAIARAGKRAAVELSRRARLAVEFMRDKPNVGWMEWQEQHGLRPG